MISGTKLTTGIELSSPIRLRAESLLEDEREHPVGRADRDEVHHGCLRGEQQRAESDHQHEEAERRDDQDDQRRACC